MGFLRLLNFIAFTMKMPECVTLIRANIPTYRKIFKYSVVQLLMWLFFTYNIQHNIYRLYVLLG